MNITSLLTIDAITYPDTKSGERTFFVDDVAQIVKDTDQGAFFVELKNKSVFAVSEQGFETVKAAMIKYAGFTV